MAAPHANKILIVSHEFDPHADRMVALLNYLKVECVRWLPQFFPLKSRISLQTGETGFQGLIDTDYWQADPRTIRSVWYRQPAAPILPASLGPDERRFADGEVRATLSGLFQVFDWFWVNHPDRSRIAGSKILQLKTAQEIGFRIPKTLVTNDPERVRAFFHACDGNIIYKPFYSGFFVGTENACFTSPVSLEKLSQIDLIANTPGIFQERLPKRIELRITVIGRKVFATEIHSQTATDSLSDWRRADIETLPHDVHALPHDIEARCLKLLDRFDLAYGAIDMVVTPGGDYVFLENNPSGQFGWIENKTGQPLTEALAKMLIAGHSI
jgi:glutathione synthase/RimK-type ligase-like ATP-grasp enzyme